MKFEILSKVRIEDNIVYLPKGQLARDLYVDVNEVLVNLNGKWNRSKGGHVFGYDPTDALGVVIETHTVPPKNPTAFHPTPLDIIELALADMGEWLNNDWVRMLEPSAGTGNASKMMMEYFPEAHLDVVEYLPLNAGILRKSHANVFEMDFLEYDTGDYDFIFMNPPFSIEGNKTVYIDHIRHAHSLLKSNRDMFVIVPSGFLTNSTKKISAFRKWCFDRLLWLEKIEGGKFSTTKVSTVMMKLSSEAWAVKEKDGWVSRNAWVASLIIDDTESLSYPKKFDKWYWDSVHREGMACGEYFVLDDADKEQLMRHYKDFE